MGTSISHTVSVARALFGQMRAFGILARHGPNAREVFGGLITQRISLLRVLLELLQTLDAKSVREAIASGDPIIYNTAEWPKGAPLAGKFDVGGPISLEGHLASWFMAWNLQLGDESRSGMGPKVVRAALWLLMTSGNFNEAIDYVVDLQTKGVIIDDAAAAEAIRVLFQARRLVKNDIDLIDFLLDKDAANLPDWTRAQFKNFDLDGQLVREDLQDDFDALLTRAEGEIEMVLNASSYDRWVVGQLGLYSLLTVVEQTFKRFQLDKSLQFIARLTRIEEIRADAGGFARLFKVWAGRFIFI